MPAYKPVEELMAVLCAREVRPGDRFGVGIQSAIAAVGAVLAKSWHVPAARLMTRGLPGGELVAGTREPHSVAMAGKMDLFFLTPAQFDGQLDVNFERLRNADGQWQYLSGAFAVPVYYSVVRRVVLLVPDHSIATLPARVDYVTAAGRPRPRDQRSGGPVRVITSKAVLDVDWRTGRIELLSYHPGESVDSVRAATGFDLAVSSQVGATALPTPEELDALNRIVYPSFAPGAVPWRAGKR